MIYRDAIRKLIVLDCKELPRRGGGSHRRWYNPRTGRATILPDWGNRDLKIGTLKAAIKQLGIEWDVFSEA
ncbi:MAG: type II toxin-antitoxin system HicA family toxin [Coprothermobacterota bacterium]|nr:type II toxin-antitoxin system HicA family toxin [Coprothermobacterota bacterium]